MGSTTELVIDFALEPTPMKAVKIGDKALDRVLNTRRTNALFSEWEAQDREAQVQNTYKRIQEIHALLVEKKQYGQADPPTPEDVWDVFRRVGEMWPRAGNSRKRKMIQKAFFESFSPQFYAEGVSIHFLEILDRIQYPDARLLATLVRGGGKQAKIDIASMDYFYANNLSKLGLLARRSSNSNFSTFQILAIASQFIEFAWPDEYTQQP